MTLISDKNMAAGSSISTEDGSDDFLAKVEKDLDSGFETPRFSVQHLASQFRQSKIALDEEDQINNDEEINMDLYTKDHGVEGLRDSDEVSDYGYSPESMNPYPRPPEMSPFQSFDDTELRLPSEQDFPNQAVRSTSSPSLPQYQPRNPSRNNSANLENDISSIKDKGFDEISVQDMAVIAYKMSLSLEICDRSYHLKKYKNVFLGNDTVNFLIANEFAKSISEAIKLGNKMIEHGFFIHTTGEHGLENKKLFYRFLTTNTNDLQETNPVSRKKSESQITKINSKSKSSFRSRSKTMEGNGTDEDSPSASPRRKMSAISSFRNRTFSSNSQREKKNSQKASIRDEKEETEKTDQDHWEELSNWLQSLKFRNVQELPKTFDCETKLLCPGFANAKELKSVTCLRRFNSRKVPHMVELTSVDDEVKRYIYKQDDDISMDVAVMNLLKKANDIWEREGLSTFIRTYDVVSCPDLTGFGEIVPGQTMLNLKSENIVTELAGEKEKWENFYNSLIAIVVTTAAFDITDRHHANIIFAPDGDIALIDLSASLGKQAPLDSTFKINPIYYPARIRKVHNILRDTIAPKYGLNCRKWSNFEADATRAFFALYTDDGLEKLLGTSGYTLIPPWKFLYLLNKRKDDDQGREHARNLIVNKMDNSTAFNNFVAGVTAILPIN